MQAWICLHALFLMNKTKDQASWVLSHDLYWENKMYKPKRSIASGAKSPTSHAGYVKTNLYVTQSESANVDWTKPKYWFPMTLYGWMKATILLRP